MTNVIQVLVQSCEEANCSLHIVDGQIEVYDIDVERSFMTHSSEEAIEVMKEKINYINKLST